MSCMLKLASINSYFPSLIQPAPRCLLLDLSHLSCKNNPLLLHPLLGINTLLFIPSYLTLSPLYTQYAIITTAQYLSKVSAF